MPRRRARAKGTQAHRQGSCRNRHRSALAFDRRGRGRAVRRACWRSVRRHPCAGACVFPARRQRFVLPDSAELHDAGARGRNQDPHARR